jgi:hydrogenase maturation protease
MGNSLIVCIGNVARGDDGVAHAVYEQLLDSPPDRALLVCAVDLDVAMASDVAQTDLLIVVDAQRRSEPAVVLSQIPATASGRATGHGMDAPTLVSLASSLYGHTPKRAVVVSVAAPQMGHGVGLSRTARAASSEAARAVRELILADTSV